MKLRRRELLSGAGTLLASAPFLTAQTHAATAPPLLVFDNRLAVSREFARKNAALTNAVIDISTQDARLWRELRTMAASVGELIGLTGWSDWVIVRGLAQEQGKRVHGQLRLDVDTLDAGYRVTPFLWKMA